MARKRIGKNTQQNNKDIAIINIATQKLIDKIFDLNDFNGNVYHYTSTSAVKSILESKSLWMTDYSYLSDASEIEHGLGIYVSLLEKYKGNTFIDYIFSTDYQKSLTTLFPLCLYRTFVFSFSKEKDSKSQWAEYGDSNEGLALGFCLKKVFDKIFGKEYQIVMKEYTTYSERILLSKVIYDDKLKSELLETYIKDVLELCESGNSEMYVKIFSEMFYTVMKILPYFKSRTFSNEDEYRLVLQFPNRLLNKTISELKGISYTVKNKKIVPYFKLELSDIENIISEINIGPKYIDRFAENTIQDFCNSVSLGSIKIERSKLKIR